MIADQIAGRAADSDSGRQQSHLEVSEILFATAIGVGDQCMNGNTAICGGNEGILDLPPVKAEDHNLHSGAGALNSFHNRAYAAARLYQ